jgi:hypothetical protein
MEITHKRSVYVPLLLSNILRLVRTGTQNCPHHAQETNLKPTYQRSGEANQLIYCPWILLLFAAATL